MAIPASNIKVADAWNNILGGGMALKTLADKLAAASALGDTPRHDYSNLKKVLADNVKRWDTEVAAVGIPDIQDYGRIQLADPTYILQADYDAMRTAADTLRVWLNDGIPRESGTPSQPLLISEDEFGVQTPLMFSTAQTETFRANVAIFTATIG